MPERNEQPLTYTVEEAAKLLRIGRNQAYEAARSRELPTIRIGKRILVPRVALERMLEAAAAKAA
jgi:excisionase family DNA binding protein